jgi:hypothetical protein
MKIWLILLLFNNSQPITSTDNQTDCHHTYIFSRNSEALHREHKVKFKKLFNSIPKSPLIINKDPHDHRL